MMEPWRNTGVEIRGPAVVELERAFANVWQACGGNALPTDRYGATYRGALAGDVRLRVIAGAPSGTGTYRLDLVIASLAHRQLWLTDAYFVGTAAYVQALAQLPQLGPAIQVSEGLWRTDNTWISLCSAILSRNACGRLRSLNGDRRV